MDRGRRTVNESFQQVLEETEEALVSGSCERARNALDYLGEQVETIDNMHPIEDAAAVSGSVRELQRAANSAQMRAERAFNEKCSTSQFRGLGAGLGFDASAHNVLLKHALVAVTESAARGQESLKRKSCDSAFADLLTVKEFMGKARAHASSMGDDPNEAVEPVRLDAMNLFENFRKKCLRKR